MDSFYMSKPVNVLVYISRKITHHIMVALPPDRDL